MIEIVREATHLSTRRMLHPSNVVPIVMIAGVTILVGYANWRDAARSDGTSSPLLRRSTAGADTSREHLEQRVRELEVLLASRPGDVRAAVTLADTLMRQSRVTGNGGLMLRAEHVVAQALSEHPGDYEARRMLAAVYLSQHRFREAIALANESRAIRPDDPLNYGLIGDGYLELGDYEDAFDAFDRMMQLRPSAAAYARVAYARELQGDLGGAIDSMELAAGATNAADLEGLAWTHSQIGDLYYQLGKLPEARQAYAIASQAFPGHPFAVMGYARVVALEGDLAGALTLLQSLAQRSPTPEVAARIGDLLERLGRHAEAERQYALAEAGWRADAPEPKDLAKFLADRGRKTTEAVQIAEKAAAERRDIFTLDALAWAYFKAGRLGDARRALALALRTGVRDREILGHAEAIASVTRQMASQ